jgi:hypothetical protein
LRRLLAIACIDAGGLRMAAFFEILQALTYLPFFAGVGILVDKSLQNPALTLELKYRYILWYALANLALWPLHAWFTVGAFTRAQLLARAALQCGFLGPFELRKKLTFDHNSFNLEIRLDP